MRLPKNLQKQYRQLPLDIDIDDVIAGEEKITPDEARLLSQAAQAALESRSELPEWYEQYRTLREAGFTWRVACYISWKASPVEDRWPKNQQSLATEVLGLTSDRVIATWRKKNPMIDEWIEIMQAAPLMDKRGDVLHALVESASNPDHRHGPDRRTFLQLTGDLTDRLHIERELTVEDLSSLSDAELEKLAGRFMTALESTEDSTDE